MITAVFAGIACGTGLIGLIVSLLAMFRKMVEQTTAMKVTMDFLKGDLEELKGDIRAIRNTQRGR